MQHAVFDILTPRLASSLTSQADDIMCQLTALMEAKGLTTNRLLQARLYVSDAANQCGVIRRHTLYRLLNPLGCFSFIEQPPLNGRKLALLVWFLPEGCCQRIVGETERQPWSILRQGNLSFYYQSVRFSAENNCLKDSDSQTQKAFSIHIDFLKLHGLNLYENCLRTWIYVRDVDCHYAGVVSGRNSIFDHEGLTAETHYIASTGIGGAGESRRALVAVDFLSVEGLSPEQVGYLHAPDYLNPTQEYGVAFERGTYVDFPEGRTFFISGTASIDRHGECLYCGDVMAQTERLFVNIQKLLESGGGDLSEAKYFLVYLRDVADKSLVEAYMEERFPQIPYLITEARVCRPEWLIEVECMAVRNA